MLSLVLVCLLGVAFSHPLDLKTCPFPNGSETAMHTYECMSNMQLSISDIKVLDLQNNPLYPMDPKKPMVLDLIAYNHGSQIVDNSADVKLFEYGTSWTSNDCKWKEIPTLGLLNGINGCEFAKNCPLTTGNLTLKLELDLSKFAQIINMLAGNKPYELEITMHDLTKGANPKAPIACVVAQMHLI